MSFSRSTKLGIRIICPSEDSCICADCCVSDLALQKFHKTCWYMGKRTLSEVPDIAVVLSGVRVTRSLVLCVMFCRSLFVRLSGFFWSLCCLTFFDLWLLITPLVSLNSSRYDIAENLLFNIAHSEVL
jgi:hypothetical protein